MVIYRARVTRAEHDAGDSLENQLPRHLFFQAGPSDAPLLAACCHGRDPAGRRWSATTPWCARSTMGDRGRSVGDYVVAITQASRSWRYSRYGGLAVTGPRAL